MAEHEASLAGMIPPHLSVALEWVAASGELGLLRALDEVPRTALCERSAAAFCAALVAEGGLAVDATVTAAPLVELAAWLRALARPPRAGHWSDC